MGERLKLEEKKGQVVFRLRIAPRASRNGFGGLHDGALKVSLTAAPVGGAANAALIKFLSKALGVPKKAIEILSGESSRNKRIGVSAPDKDALQVKLEALAGI